MASIGLRTAKYNKIDYATKKYAALAKESIVPVLGRLIDAKVNPEKNSTKLYADDIEAESDTSFKGGTVNITLDDVTDEQFPLEFSNVILTLPSPITLTILQHIPANIT